MCGRFAITLPPEAMAALFDAAPANDLPEVPNHNVCPTNQVHAVLPGEARRRLVSMRWGFIPHWYGKPNDGPLLINARAETIAEKPAFRAACRARRCLVPASGFYEWTKDDAGTRYPWYIRRADAAPLAFAGIWQAWERDGQALTTCAIVTAAARGQMTQVHPRTPVTLAQEHWPLWLGEAEGAAAPLMQTTPEQGWEIYRVGREVNSNRASGEGLIRPLETPEPG
jgi:putative SOS response-associated peptidase YedK